MVRAFARVAFLLSGVAGLTFEIVWTRYLGLAVGGTTLTIATITAAYMGGLAFGSHLGGKIADRLSRPLAVYGAIEALLAAVAFAIPSMCAFIPQVDAALFADVSGGASRALVRFVVAVTVLILPTTAMGMTLPILARAVAHRLGSVGREVGLLYAINIAGAMLGAALAGFAFIPNLGLFRTNMLAAGLDLGVGLVALTAGLLLPAAPNVSTEAAREAPRLRPGTSTLVALLALTGAAAMALQVLWTRGLSTALGPSTYAFSAIVCAYLLGLALGGAAASRLADRATAARAALAFVLLGTGAGALFGINVVDDLPSLLRLVVLNPELTAAGLMHTEFWLAALCLLPATLGMGAIFPLTISAVVGNEARLGAAVGTAYAVNTVGAIFGSFAGVFVLLPLFGVEWGMRVAALAYVAAAAVLARRLEPSVQPRTRKALLAGTGVLAVAMLAWPSWDVVRWTAGLYRLSMTRAYFASDDVEPAALIFHRDGLSATVTVEEEEGVRWIKVDGKVDGSSYGDMPTQVLSGLLPMMLHPDPEEVAVIGCGSGVTVGAALQADPKHVVLVEIEKEVIEGAKLFSAVNHAPWDDPRLTIVEDDGRNFMRRGTSRFDVIVSEPSNPWMTGAASLFTRDFFEIAAKRLEDDGLFLQWLQIYELAPERIGSILKTFNSVFPHLYVFSAHVQSNDLLLVGSRRPLSLSWQRLDERFRTWKSELERTELRSVGQLLALWLIDERALEALPPSIELNTDDNALVEFGAPRDLVQYAQADPELPFLRQPPGARIELVRRYAGISDAEWPAYAVRMADGYLRHGMLEEAAAVLDGAERDLHDPTLAEQAAELTDIARLLVEDDSVDVIDVEVFKQDRAYAEVAGLMALGKDGLARDKLAANAEFGKRGPAHALVEGFLRYREGDWEGARVALIRAASAQREEYRPIIAYYLAKGAYGEGEYLVAVDEMTRYRRSLRGNLSPSASTE